MPRDGEDGFISSSTSDAEHHNHLPAIVVGRFTISEVYPYMAQSVSK